jgi:hypothetical protein
MKYRGNTRNFELRVLEVGRCPVDAGKIRLFTQALAEADAEDVAKLKFDYERGIREND